MFIFLSSPCSIFIYSLLDYKRRIWGLPERVTDPICVRWNLCDYRSLKLKPKFVTLSTLPPTYLTRCGTLYWERSRCLLPQWDKVCLFLWLGLFPLHRRRPSKSVVPSHSYLWVRLNPHRLKKQVLRCHNPSLSPLCPRVSFLSPYLSHSRPVNTPVSALRPKFRFGCSCVVRKEVDQVPMT